MPELVAVPNLPGIPAVAFAPGFGARPTLATADDPAVLRAHEASGSPQWGLFLNGRSVIQADGVVAFDHRREWVVCDYPVERGAFASYNKVNIPFDVRLVFMAGINSSNRATLINSVAAIAGDLKFYDAVMPEKVWRSLNVTHYDFARTAQRGSGLLTVALWCREIRQVSASAAGGSAVAGADPSATGNIGQTAAPSGANPINGGSVQARDATPGEIASAGNQAAPGGFTPNVSTSTVGGTNATATELTGPNVSPTVQGVPTQNVTELSISQAAPVPQTSSTISGLQAAGPDQYSMFGVSP